MKSITVKLLIIIASGLLIANTITLFLANIQLKKVIDQSQSAVYSERIETIFKSLKRSNDRLEKTGMVDVYADDFKASILESLQQTYYDKKDVKIFPFILDMTGRVIMHPTIPKGQVLSKEFGITDKMLSCDHGSSGDFHHSLEICYFFRQFPEWGWAIGYSIPLEIKYQDARKFLKSLILVMGCITVLVLLVLTFIVKKFTEPIIRLTGISTAMAGGELDQQINIDSIDEIGTLAQSFSLMRDSVKMKIDELSKEILERKQAEETLRENEERYRMLFNNSNDAVFVHQPDKGGKLNNFIEVNDVACQIYGYTRKELLELAPIDLTFPEQKEIAHMQISKLFSDGYNVFEIEHKAKDGKKIPVEVSAQLFDFHDQPTVLSIVRDITDRKKAEEERLTLETQLQQSQKMESIGTLAGGIAHDFNNILSPILGFTEMLQEDLPQDSPEQKSVAEVFKAALRAKNLVKQILTFSRQHNQELKPVKIQSILKEALKLLGASIPKTIDIQTDIDPDCGVVVTDPTQVHQIIMNLSTNAYHAMQESGGKLKICLGQTDIELIPHGLSQLVPGKYALLKVIDTGSGIKKDVVDKVFEPYFTTKAKDKGTGLGLSVVQGIIRNLHGDIHIYSEFGKGTEVHVYLPIMKKTSINEKFDSLKPIIGGNERILLVDDEESIVNMEQEMLERLGYNVTPRTESIDALETFKANPDKFDLVISDMTMPNLTGVQLSNEIKAVRIETPIIICTGFSDLIDKDSCKELGIQGYVAKPVIKRKFARIIRNVIDKSKN